MSGFVGTAFKLAFELSPIFLTGNSPVTFNILGGVVPMIALTEALSLPLQLITGGGLNLDDFFAHFVPLPGGTLIDNQVAMYPFANQAVAGNAIITQPLQVSMKMICPVRTRLGYAAKIATMNALRAALDAHNTHGGTYTVLTPSYFYTNCLMTGMRDISGGESAQAQHTWQLDFVRPLLTLEQAQAAQNGLMSKLTNGGQVSDPGWSGDNATIGQSTPDVSPGTTSGGLTGTTPAGGAPLGPAIAPPEPATSPLPSTGTTYAPGSTVTVTPPDPNSPFVQAMAAKGFTVGPSTTIVAPGITPTGGNTFTP